MAQEPTRTARIEARITPEALAVVKRAAEIQGRSVSDFVVAAAQEAAARTIEETQIIRLSVEDQRAFAEAILNPPEPGPALKRAFRRHRELIKDSR
ncbi:MAG: type II toxin-antitoxin system TacA family antitoxin [Methylovirgula sp.]